MNTENSGVTGNGAECMKEKILQLRAEGKSYKQIHKELGCSTGLIAYHCGDGQKKKATQRKKLYLSTLRGILKRKKDNFSHVHRIRGRKRYNRRESLSFSSKDFLSKMTANPVCYLTGRPIDLLAPKTYQCDHITPVAKGGKSTLDNLGIACRDANQSKHDLTLEEYLQLCKEVLVHHGFDVIDKR